MHKSKEMSRSTWSGNGKYLIMVHAKFNHPFDITSRPTAKAVVHVYNGDPVLNGRSAIFISQSELNCADLLDELQNAERIGREYVDELGNV